MHATCGCALFQAHIPSYDHLGRGKMSVAVNMKRKEGASVVKRLCNNADVLIEPFRPGMFTSLYCCHVFTSHTVRVLFFGNVCLSVCLSVNMITPEPLQISL